MKEKLPYAENFRELIVYKKAESLAKDIYEESRSFPKEETYSLTNSVHFLLFRFLRCVYLLCISTFSAELQYHQRHNR